MGTQKIIKPKQKPIIGDLTMKYIFNFAKAKIITSILFLASFIGFTNKSFFSEQKDDDDTWNGTDILVFMDGTKIAGEAEATASFSHDPRPANTKASGRWEASAEGALSGEISVDGLVMLNNQPASLLFDAVISKTPVTLIFGVDNDGSPDTSELRYIGEFRVTKFDDSAPHRDTRAFSATFSSTGAIQKLTDVS